MKKIMIMLTLLIVLGGCTQTKAPIRPSFTMETYPKTDCSTVTIPLSEMLMATVVDKSIAEIRPYVLSSKTHQAYVNVIDRMVDLIFVTSPSKDEQDYAALHKTELEIIPIVSEAFVFLVNKDNPVDSLTLEQIQKIYSGEITNWKDLGGNDVAIRAMQRPENSGSQTGFLSLVMKDLTVMTPPVDWISIEMGELIDSVSHYDNQPDAIGYSYYYYVMDMVANPDVKLLKIDGVYPEPTTISNGSYSIKTNYFAVFRKTEEAKSDVRNLVDYLLSDDGQAMIEHAGYVKLK